MVSRVKSSGRRLRVVLAILGGLLLAIGVGEVSLRLLGIDDAPRRHFSPGIYAVDSELGWTLQPDYRGVHRELTYDVPTQTNAEGFRGAAWSAERMGAEQRILVLGDSCTFGRGVAEDETYPYQLELLLRERGRETAVFNAGIPGYDTVQEAGLLERLGQRVRPQLLVVGWLSNDATEPSQEVSRQIQILDGYLVRDRERFRAWRRQIERGGLYQSALYRFLGVRWRLLKRWLGLRRSRYQRGEQPAASALGPSQQALLAIQSQARRMGASVLLVLFPRQEELDPGASLAHHDAMAEFARARGMGVVHLPRAWQQVPRSQDWYLPRDGVHLTSEGYRQVAQGIVAHELLSR